MLSSRSFTGRALAAGLTAAICVFASASAAEQSLEDIQIGERGRTMRIALICTTRCAVAADGSGDFRLEGVRSSLDVDLAARSALVRRLVITPENGSSRLQIDPVAAITGAAIITCQSETEPAAPCIELTFAQGAGAQELGGGTTPVTAARLAKPGPREKKPATPAPAKPAPTTPAPAVRDPGLQAAPSIRDSVSIGADNIGADNVEPPENIPFLGAAVLVARPSLREETGRELLAFPQFAPPERLAPPQPTQPKPESRSDAGEQIIDPSIEIDRPALIVADRAEALAASSVDIRSEAQSILGKTVDVGACEGAKARLMADAWALESMIDLAFCRAADGDLDAADSDFARLLAYTPDNYEALVGRGLIATARGDHRLGRKYFQDALNALPPIAESDRIVSAMERY
jgi:hypothetical protein